MATSIFVDPKLKPHPLFKLYPYVAIVRDKEGAFSRVPIDCFYIKDVREYILVELKEVNHLKFYDIWDNLTEANMTTFKEKYKKIFAMGLNTWKDFPNFSYKEEWIKIILNPIHKDTMYLNKPYKITRDVIRTLTSRLR